MVQFMSWPYLFWINLPVVFVIFCITWWGLTGLPRMDVKGGIDWIGVTLLGAALVLLNIGLGAPEVGLEGSTALPSPHRLYWVAGGRGGVRRLPDVSAARARSDPRPTHLLEPQSVGGERRQSARRLLHHGGARQRAHLHQRRGRGRHDEGGPGHGIPALRLYRADGARGHSRRLALRTARLSIVGRPRFDHGHRRLLDDESVEGGNGRPGGRLLRQPATRPRAGRRSWHRLHGGGAGAGRHRHRVDHRANRGGGHQRRAANRTAGWRRRSSSSFA